jgi:hypothetical protein
MFLALALALAAPLAAADVLLIEEVRQVDRMEVPVNGQTMTEVESRFGAPSRRYDAVGEPPITRWQYESWSVYFEHDRVLYTVLHHGQVIEKPQPGP